MLKIPGEYDRNISLAKICTFLTKFLPSSLLGVLADIFQRALVAESGMIRMQMGKHKRSENGHSAWDTLYNTSL
jgi:hypothetical protein